MITLINATNRPENLTGKVVAAYAQILTSLQIEHQIFEVSELQDDFVFATGFGKKSEHLSRLIDKYIVPASKFVFFAPEYNGSYPGILKCFIDVVNPSVFAGKRAALVGVATGRAGNLRGMDHLTDVLHHLGVEVLSFKVPISRLDILLSTDGLLEEKDTLAQLAKQIEKLKAF